MAKTLANLLTEWRDLIAQPDSANSNFTDAQGTRWLNDAYRRIYMRLSKQDALIGKTDYSSVSGGEFTLNSNQVNIHSVKMKVQPLNKFRELDVITLHELMLREPDWENMTTDIPKYLVRLGLRTMMLYPLPNAANLTQTIRVYGVSLPTELSVAADTPSIPEALQDILPHWAAFRSFRTLGMDDKATQEITIFRGALKDEQDFAGRIAPRHTGRMRFEDVEESDA